MMIAEFPLFLFTTLGGLSAGLALALAIFPFKGERNRPWLAALVCLVLLGLGLLGVLFHLGRPERFFLGLSNPSAGIAQEGYCSIVLGIVLLIQFVIALRKGKTPRMLDWVAGILGLLLMFVMGFSYSVYLGIPNWDTWGTVALFVVGDIVMGLALRALFDADVWQSKAFLPAYCVASVLLAIVFVFEGVVFSGAGQSGSLFFVAAFMAPVLSVVAAIWQAKKPSQWLPCALFACVIVGVCIARLAFYSTSVL